LVFNRGYSLTGDSRREMKNIQNFIDPQNLSKIANEIRSMKRLWPNVKGLIARRETEALLVENADFRILRENQINV
jgi:GH24 family phage-related lysozyme (muramidase)